MAHCIGRPCLQLIAPLPAPLAGLEPRTPGGAAAIALRSIPTWLGGSPGDRTAVEPDSQLQQSDCAAGVVSIHPQLYVGSGIVVGRQRQRLAQAGGGLLGIDIHCLGVLLFEPVGLNLVDILDLVGPECRGVDQHFIQETSKMVVNRICIVRHADGQGRIVVAGRRGGALYEFVTHAIDVERKRLAIVGCCHMGVLVDRQDFLAGQLHQRVACTIARGIDLALAVQVNRIVAVIAFSFGDDWLGAGVRCVRGGRLDPRGQGKLIQVQLIAVGNREAIVHAVKGCRLRHLTPAPGVRAGVVAASGATIADVFKGSATRLCLVEMQ